MDVESTALTTMFFAFVLHVLSTSVIVYALHAQDVLTIDGGSDSKDRKRYLEP